MHKLYLLKTNELIGWATDELHAQCDLAEGNVGNGAALATPVEGDTFDEMPVWTLATGVEGHIVVAFTEAE